MVVPGFGACVCVGLHQRGDSTTSSCVLLVVAAVVMAQRLKFSPSGYLREQAAKLADGVLPVPAYRSRTIPPVLPTLPAQSKGDDPNLRKKKRKDGVREAVEAAVKSAVPVRERPVLQAERELVRERWSTGTAAATEAATATAAAESASQTSGPLATEGTGVGLDEGAAEVSLYDIQQPVVPVAWVPPPEPLPHGRRLRGRPAGSTRAQMALRKTREQLSRSAEVTGATAAATAVANGAAAADGGPKRRGRKKKAAAAVVVVNPDLEQPTNPSTRVTVLPEA